MPPLWDLSVEWLSAVMHMNTWGEPYLSACGQELYTEHNESSLLYAAIQQDSELNINKVQQHLH